MNISEAIAKLEDLKATHGDVDFYLQGRVQDIQHDVKSISSEQLNGSNYILIQGENEFVV
ncbi:hypothetical protein [Cysteiniphilum halobium]|uniref:hypothetical protein n=1 Tax=Cysteiniphilum halobium TaxID=2219059 RepID=UPI000E64C7F9|nr:hypothetical protein [Cysteiniphilum halobium]